MDPQIALRTRNTIEMSRPMLLQVLTHLSTLLPRQIELVAHGGAVLLLHPTFCNLPNPTRTSTRDVDVLMRSFRAEYGWEAEQGLLRCVKETARLFKLGEDWLNGDADIALPMAKDPDGSDYDPIYRAAKNPTNPLRDVFESPNGRLKLIGVSPAWAIALKLVRFHGRDPGDIGVILQNGRLNWTPDKVEDWLLDMCKPMLYHTYDASRMRELRGRIKHALRLIGIGDGGWHPNPSLMSGGGGASTSLEVSGPLSGWSDMANALPATTTAARPATGPLSGWDEPPKIMSPNQQGWHLNPAVMTSPERSWGVSEPPAATAGWRNQSHTFPATQGGWGHSPLPGWGNTSNLQQSTSMLGWGPPPQAQVASRWDNDEPSPFVPDQMSLSGPPPPQHQHATGWSPNQPMTTSPSAIARPKSHSLSQQQSRWQPFSSAPATNDRLYSHHPPPQPPQPPSSHPMPSVFPRSVEEFDRHVEAYAGPIHLPRTKPQMYYPTPSISPPERSRGLGGIGGFMMLRSPVDSDSSDGSGSGSGGSEGWVRVETKRKKSKSKSRGRHVTNAMLEGRIYAAPSDYIPRPSTTIVDQPGSSAAYPYPTSRVPSVVLHEPSSRGGSRPRTASVFSGWDELADEPAQDRRRSKSRKRDTVPDPAAAFSGWGEDAASISRGRSKSRRRDTTASSGFSGWADSSASISRPPTTLGSSALGLTI